MLKSDKFEEQEKGKIVYKVGVINTEYFAVKEILTTSITYLAHNLDENIVSVTIPARKQEIDSGHLVDEAYEYKASVHREFLKGMFSRDKIKSSDAKNISNTMLAAFNDVLIIKKKI